ncbi:MAG: LTA synthase family protein [Agathobacter sp.]|nr:LTA synthase family protein [Agathobacter sp.]
MKKNEKINNTKPIEALEELDEAEEIEDDEETLDLVTRRMLLVLRVLVFSIVPILLFYLMEAFEHNAFEEVRSKAQIYNILLFELIAWLLFFITGSGKVALRIETVVAFVYGLANHYVMAFRSTPLVPWDLFSIKTAASVVENYDFTPTNELLQVCAAFVVLFVLLRFLNFKFPYGIFMRIIPTVCVGLVLCTFVNLLWDDEFQTKSRLYPFLFTPAHMTKVNGMAVTFAMNLEYVHVSKPDGYSKTRAEEILKEYETKESDKSPEEYPNVIVVMNEAFSDLSVLGDFETNEDYMPFIHSLQLGQENTITGKLEVSVCGGNTANSEFEFLTGHTMDYFPVGSIPYQQYITGNLPSLASQLLELGYATYGMHPYNSTGWKRNEVYPWLGFEEAYFIRDFEDRFYIRDYVSDQTAYQKIIDIYEAKEEGKPAFIFEVTMQNHGGYTETHENFTPDVHAMDLNSAQLDRYLSLMKISDQEFENLVQYFEKEEEKTILVFFGDHQPSDAVVRPILLWNQNTTGAMKEIDPMLRYQVPYVVWANFDIEEATDVDTDISFLAAQVLECADMPTTAYQNFLLELGKDPDSDKRKSQYEILQYYFMFDYQEAS